MTKTTYQCSDCIEIKESLQKPCFLETEQKDIPNLCPFGMMPKCHWWRVGLAR